MRVHTADDVLVALAGWGTFRRTRIEASIRVRVYSLAATLRPFRVVKGPRAHQGNSGTSALKTTSLSGTSRPLGRLTPSLASCGRITA